MNLHRVSKKFDTSLFTDYFGVGSSFYGQVNPYTEGVRSSAPTRRRVLSTAPDVVIPSGRVVTTQGVTYVLGAPSEDFHRGTVIRIKYAMSPADTFFTVRSIPQLLSGAAGTTSVAAMLFRAEVVVTSFDRFYRVPKYEIYFSSVHEFPEDSVFTSTLGTFFSTVKSGIDGVGIGMTEAVDVGSTAFRTVAVTCVTGKNIVSETQTTTAYAAVPALIIYARYAYEFLSGDNKDIEPGDYIAWLPKSVVLVAPKEGSTVDGKRVVSYREDPTGVWRVLLRIS